VNHTRKTLVAAASQVLHRNLLWFLLAAYFVAAFWPIPGLWLKDLSFGEIAPFGQDVPVTLPMLLLAVMLFNAGLGVHISSPKELFRTSRLLVAGLAANFLVPLSFLFLVAQGLAYWHEADEARSLLLGLAIVVAMPVAGSSSAWSQNYNGNLTLSLGLILLSTLLSPLSTPLSLHAVTAMLGDDASNELGGLTAIGSSSFLVFFVALPSALGILCRRAVSGARVDRINPHVKLVNSLILLALNYINATASLPEVVKYPDWDFIALIIGMAVLMCIITFTSGWWLGSLLGADQASRIALMFGLGMSNNGSGLVLAAATLAGQPRVMLPIIVYNLVQHLVAGSAAYLIRNDSARPHGIGEEPPSTAAGSKSPRSRSEKKVHQSYFGSVAPGAPG
jgi:BASS family bile acid:Na+ symporter